MCTHANLRCRLPDLLEQLACRCGGETCINDCVEEEEEEEEEEEDEEEEEGVGGGKRQVCGGAKANGPSRERHIYRRLITSPVALSL